jgi:hypothetical protein
VYIVAHSSRAHALQYSTSSELNAEARRDPLLSPLKKKKKLKLDNNLDIQYIKKEKKEKTKPFDFRSVTERA